MTNDLAPVFNTTAERIAHELSSRHYVGSINQLDFYAGRSAVSVNRKPGAVAYTYADGSMLLRNGRALQCVAPTLTAAERWCVTINGTEWGNRAARGGALRDACEAATAAAEHGGDTGLLFGDGSRLIYDGQRARVCAPPTTADRLRLTLDNGDHKYRRDALDAAASSVRSAELLDGGGLARRYTYTDGSTLDLDTRTLRAIAP